MIRLGRHHRFSASDDYELTLRNLKNQWAKHRPPTLPFSNNNTSSNPYANNPPPPNNTNWNDNSYGNNPPPPPQTYQPATAGQYGAQPKETRTEGDHEHGYEWQQAREAERLEREGANATQPPGYDVAASRAYHRGSLDFTLTTEQNTGNATGYAPPPGAPPK